MNKYVVHIYDGILLHLKTKNEIIPLTATWIDLEITSVASQAEKVKYKMLSLTCGT